MKALLVTSVIMLCAGHALSQRIDEDRQYFIDQVMELLSENLENEELDYTTLLEELNDILDHPIDLNKADEESLRRIVFLSEFQIRELLLHRALTGNFLSIYELQGVKGFDAQSIAMVRPFLTLAAEDRPTKITWKQLKEGGSHEAFVRYERILEQQLGSSPIDDSLLAANPNSRYVGSPERLLARYRFRYSNRVSAGFTMEKDAGEGLGGPYQPQGFDFYSAHLYLTGLGAVKQMVIGDYQAQFGQGLCHWTGMAFGKSGNILGINRNARKLLPYVSADENNFMRGAAATVGLGDVDITGFISYKSVDANVDEADSTGVGIPEFTSFQLSGLHTTPSQIEDRKSVNELNTGAHMRYKHLKAIEMGVTGAYTRYEGQISAPEQLYKSLESTDSDFLVCGLDYRVVKGNLMVFGESAFRSDGGVAYLNGALISMDQYLDVSILNRHYSPEYNVPRSNAVGENSRTTNEQGTFMGISSSFSRAWKINAYYDLFDFPWLRYRVDAPSNGSEFFAQLEFTPNRQAHFYVRYRNEAKARNHLEMGSPTHDIGLVDRTWYRFNWQYSLNKVFTLRGRLEHVVVRLPEEQIEAGWLVYQDVIWKPSWPARLSLKLRYAVFDTDGYESRMYAYEHDLLYAFSVPAYFYKGSRAYVVFVYKFSNGNELGVRVAQTYYSNRLSSGSGLSTVEGPTRTQVKLQWRIML